MHSTSAVPNPAAVSLFVPDPCHWEEELAVMVTRWSLAARGRLGMLSVALCAAVVAAGGGVGAWRQPLLQAGGFVAPGLCFWLHGGAMHLRFLTEQRFR